MITTGSRALRLALSLGGGVSLGAFQGAAMTQAVKLAVAHGSYVADATDEGEAAGERYLYKSIYIDAISGASAGALSLLILLASLLDPSPADEVALLGQLEADPAIGPMLLAELPAERRTWLLAAQRAQNLQEQIWTRDISIEALAFAGPEAADDPQHGAAIFDRHVLSAIAAARIPASLAAQSPLLASRVLLACTLTNLTPVIASAVPSADPTAAALRDALRSNEHRELRVFDLQLAGTPADVPGRWRAFSALDAASLPEVIATAIACAAFPFAFEPVTLTRYRHEFVPDDWDGTLGAGVATHGFAYIDGGTFNNEPIREAFRLASFLDSHLLADPRTNTFDRRIIFVSPNASAERPDFSLPILRQFAMKQGTWSPYVEQLPSLNRMVPHMFTFLGTLLDQARSNEEDKVAATQARFANRDRRRAFLRRALPANPEASLFTDLLADIGAMLDSNTQNAQIPVTPLGLAGELRRVIWEEAGAGLTSDQAAALDAALRDAGELEADYFLKSPGDAPIWLYLLACIALDLALDLAGKERDAKLIGMAPFHLARVADGGDAGGSISATPLPMPASALMAFGGFLSQAASAHAFATGRYAAFNFLAASGLLADAPLLPWARAPVCDASFSGEMHARLPAFAARVKDVLTSTTLVDFPFAGAVKSAVADYVGKYLTAALDSDIAALTATAAVTVELRITLPGPDFKLARPWIDVSPVIVNNLPTLITFATRDARGAWTLAHTPDSTLTVNRDAWNQPRFCDVELPGEEALGQTDLLPQRILEIELSAADENGTVAAAGWRAVDEEALDKELNRKSA